jgi:hypothetical protein
MTTLTAEQAVQNGAAWLDLTYPGWYRNIDLSILDVSRCNVCVLGQVYTGHIPDGERNAVLAQAMLTMSPHVYPMGYTVLSARHELSAAELHSMGFLGVMVGCGLPECDDCDPGRPTYAELTDAWTTLIIGRRLNDHPDVRMQHSTLGVAEPERVAS